MLFCISKVDYPVQCHPPLLSADPDLALRKLRQYHGAYIVHSEGTEMSKNQTYFSALTMRPNGTALIILDNKRADLLTAAYYV